MLSVKTILTTLNIPFFVKTIKKYYLAHITCPFGNFRTWRFYQFCKYYVRNIYQYLSTLDVNSNLMQLGYKDRLFFYCELHAYNLLGALCDLPWRAPSYRGRFVIGLWMLRLLLYYCRTCPELLAVMYFRLSCNNASQPVQPKSQPTTGTTMQLASQLTQQACRYHRSTNRPK